MRWTTCCTLGMLLICLYAEAGTWRDDFEDGDANGWQPFTPLPLHFGVHDGVLELQIERGKRDPAYYLLEWTAMAFEASSLTVETRFPFELVFPIGIALGRHIPSDGVRGPLVECYVFMRVNRVAGVVITSAWHAGMSGRPGKEPPDEKLGPPIEHLKVTFESGRFRMFSDKDLVADFVDEDFAFIDAIGVFTMSWGEEVIGQIDDFVVSGPTIPNGNGNWAVNPEDKLSTTWGNLRRLS